MARFVVISLFLVACLGFAGWYVLQSKSLSRTYGHGAPDIEPRGYSVADLRTTLEAFETDGRQQHARMLSYDFGSLVLYAVLLLSMAGLIVSRSPNGWQPPAIIILPLILLTLDLTENLLLLRLIKGYPRSWDSGLAWWASGATRLKLLTTVVLFHATIWFAVTS